MSDHKRTKLAENPEYGITLYDYSAASVALKVGALDEDTKTAFKSISGKHNSHLRDENSSMFGGWVFPKSKKEALEYLGQLFNMDLITMYASSESAYKKYPVVQLPTRPPEPTVKKISIPGLPASREPVKVAVSSTPPMTVNSAIKFLLTKFKGSKSHIVQDEDGNLIVAGSIEEVEADVKEILAKGNRDVEVFSIVKIKRAEPESKTDNDSTIESRV